MSKEEIKQKLAALKEQLEQTVAAIQIERHEAKEDESNVIEELLINQSILEDQVRDLENLLYSTKTYSKKTYVLHQNGKRKKVAIVHPQLADTAKGMISAESPLAKLLERAKVGESFKIATPVGETEYSLLAIE